MLLSFLTDFLALTPKYGDEQKDGQQDQVDEAGHAEGDEILDKGLAPPLLIEAPHGLVEVDHHINTIHKDKYHGDDMEPFCVDEVIQPVDEQGDQEQDEGGAVDMDGKDAVVHIIVLLVPVIKDV